jgi:ribosomal-protein-alanine N-acetyltransferase
MSDAVGLTTARLALRRAVEEDLDWLDRLQGDPRVMEHVGGVMTRERSARQLRERMLDYYAAHPGLGVWVTLERATGAVAGIHLLNNIRGETLLQVGYLLFPEYWGRGYATEMCVALLRYGFLELQLPRIHAITTVPHVASQRVLLKSGLQRQGERSFSEYDGGAPMAFFARDAADWLAEHGR